MKRSRIMQTLVGVALLVTWAGYATAIGAPAGPDVAAQGAIHLALPAEDASIVSVVLDFAPGAQVPEHVHGGPLVVTILSGAITLNEDSGAKTYKAGESFTEMPGNKHSAINAGSTTARVGVSALLTKGAELQTLTDRGSKQTGVTPPAIVYQAAYHISVPAGEADLMGLVLNFAPGAGVPNHAHGGPLIVQVLLGQLTLTEDAGAKTYNVGGMFTENTGHVHNAFNEGGTPTQVLVSALIPKGADLQTIVDKAGSPPSGMPRTGSGNSDWPPWTVLLASAALFAGITLRKKSATGRP